MTKNTGLKLARKKTEGIWQADANALGWDLIGRVDGTWGSYRHRVKPDGSPCGHEQIIVATSMRKGSCRCAECESAKARWRVEADALGWDLLEQVDGNRGRYRHRMTAAGVTCGHEQIIYADKVRKGSFLCGGCEDHLSRWRREADEAGWDLHEKVDGHRASYQHRFTPDGMPCGHKQVLQAVHIRLGSARCGGCQTQLSRWRSAALAMGWDLLKMLDELRGFYRHQTKPDGSPCGHEQAVLAQAMRKGSVNCKECGPQKRTEGTRVELGPKGTPSGGNALSIEVKWRGEADARGWDLLKQVSGARALYRHRVKPGGTPCGHEQQCQAANMRMGSVRCKGCGSAEAGWRKDADAIGWDLLEKVDSSHALFRHRQTPDNTPCRHEQVLHVGALRLKQVRCGNCESHLLGWQADAAEQGWDLLGQVDKSHARYVHRKNADDAPCGHEQVLASSNMRDGHVRCEGCESPLIGWRYHAEVRGWDFLEQINGTRGRFRHRVKPDGSHCGREQEIDMGAMRRGDVSCAGCGNVGLSALHQVVHEHLKAMACSSLEVRAEAHFGVKPSMEPDGNDGPARVDFLVVTSLGYLIIEIDGSQHFRAAFTGGEDGDKVLRHQVFRDVFVEGEAMASGCRLLRFHTKEAHAAVLGIIDEALLGHSVSNRHADNMGLVPSDVHEKFWGWREEAKRAFEHRARFPWGDAQT